MIRLFLVQNINLDEENPALSGKDPFNRTRLNVSGEEPNGETMEKKRHLNRFGFGNEVSSGVAIKSKLGAIRMLDDSSSEDSTDTEESKKDPLDRFDFSVYTTIDNVPEKLPEDLLQRLLVNEMRDAIVVWITHKIPQTFGNTLMTLVSSDRSSLGRRSSWSKQFRCANRRKQLNSH